MNRIGRDDFGIIEIMLIVIIGLLGWILIWLNETDKQYSAMNTRVIALEAQNSVGQRFDAADGRLANSRIDSMEYTQRKTISLLEAIDGKVDSISEQFAEYRGANSRGTR